jgi:hypothetical protein
MTTETPTSKPSTGWLAALQGAQILLLIGGCFLAWSGRVVQTQSDVTTVATQLADLRAAVRDGFADVNARISGLPDQRVAIEALTRRATNAEAQISALDGRLGSEERGLYQAQAAGATLRSDVDDLKRASAAPIRNSR